MKEDSTTEHARTESFDRLFLEIEQEKNDLSMMLLSANAQTEVYKDGGMSYKAN